MAKIVTLQILVDDENEARIADGLNDMMRMAATPIDPTDAHGGSWIIDWRLKWGEDQIMAVSVTEEINDAIGNDTYSEGDAFPGDSFPVLPGFDYTLVPTGQDAMDSLWIKVPALREADEGGDLAVQIKRTHEGVLIDVTGGLDCELLSTACAEFSDVAEEAVAA